ncbi:hypothetical protein [Pseudoalteromonas spongiae]|uniref:Orphan protein n=1 Tax=Pseudoalteromonas spongiae TaxID=298657 RepID=A0ABU8EY46_9GAMM
MSDIILLIENNAHIALSLIIVLIFIILFKQHQQKENAVTDNIAGHAHLKLFEITANQLLVFQTLLGEMIFRHKSEIAEKLDAASKAFLEDTNAAVELNNPNKELQLKKDFQALISNTRQTVQDDQLKISLAVKQIEMLASNDLALCVLNIQSKVAAMLLHTDAYLNHLSSIAESPFDSRLQTKLALSNDDQTVLLALIDELNAQFKQEKKRLLASK